MTCTHACRPRSHALARLQHTACQASTPQQLLTTLHAKDVKVGTGATIAHGDTVVMSYVGKLANGTVFDKSDSFKFKFGVGQVSAVPVQMWQQ